MLRFYCVSLKKSQILELPKRSGSHPSTLISPCSMVSLLTSSCHAGAVWRWSHVSLAGLRVVQPSPEPLSFPFHVEREKTSNVPCFVLPLLLRTGFYCAGLVLWAGQCSHPASSTVIVPLKTSPVPALFLPFLVEGNSTDYNQSHAKTKCS